MRGKQRAFESGLHGQIRGYTSPCHGVRVTRFLSHHDSYHFRHHIIRYVKKCHLNIIKYRNEESHIFQFTVNIVYGKQLIKLNVLVNVCNSTSDGNDTKRQPWQLFLLIMRLKTKDILIVCQKATIRTYVI